MWIVVLVVLGVARFGSGGHPLSMPLQLIVLAQLVMSMWLARA